MKNIYFLILLLILALPLKAAELEQYCTTSLADGNFHKTDCSINSSFEGKNYCFGNKEKYLRSIFTILKKTRSLDTVTVLPSLF